MKKTVASVVAFLMLFSGLTFAADLQNVATIVKVIEGEVYCFDYPREMIETVEKGEIKIGTFLYRVNEYSVKVKARTKTILCYLPYEFRFQIWDQLQPGVKVMILRNRRRVHQTEWDLISVGRVVAGGSEYFKGEVARMTAAEVEKNKETADDLREDLQAEEGKTIESVQEETNQEILEENEVDIEKPGPIEEKGVEPIDGEGGDGIPAPDIDTGEIHEEEVIGEGEGPTLEEEEQQEEEKEVTPPPEPEPEPEPTPEPTPTPTTYYVHAQNGNDNNHGDTWASAWRTAKKAIDEVASRGLSDVDIYVGGTFTRASELLNANAVAGFPIDISNGEVVRIIAENPGDAVFDGENTYQIFTLGSSANVVLANLTIQNGNSGAVRGGAIYLNDANLSLDNCTLSNNQTISNGGVAGVETAGTIAVVNCTVSGNSAAVGGALYLEAGILESEYVWNSTTYSNSASTFSNNSTLSGDGGAIFADLQSQLNLSGTNTFDTNTSAGNGGAVFWRNALVFGIVGATFTSNTAVNGGALSLDDINTNSPITVAIIENCTFNNNQSTNRGGALHYSETVVDLVNCLFYDNVAADNGGALYCDTISSPNIYNCTFHNNTSYSGSSGTAIALAGTSNAVLINCIISHYLNGFLVNSVDGNNTPTLRNCDLYATPGNQLVTNAGVDGSLAEILAWGWDPGDGSGNNTCIRQFPQYKSDYNITNSSSPCVDAGVDLSTQGVTKDINGTLRPQGSAYDIGCFESVAGDPPITGRVYDSVTGELISSPTVAIYRKNSSSALEVTTSNPYSFNVSPGTYHIAVSKSGYGFPSQIVNGAVAGDHGELFEAASDPLIINIPLDLGGWLVVTKTVNKKRVQNGEIVTYNVKIQNNHWYQAVTQVELVDEVVNGFKYISGSTYRGSGQLVDPVISGRQAMFDLGTIGKRSTVNVSYQFRTGMAIPPGHYKAAAHTRNIVSKSRNSNIDSASVEVIADPLFTRGTIVGKVFWDVNADGVQLSDVSCQMLEKGIAGVKIYTEYGVCVTTDEDGKYHIADVPAENHLLKVDPSTLPEGVKFTTENPYFVKVTEGLLCKVNFGVKEQLSAEEEESGLAAGCQKLLANFFIVALGEGTLQNLNTSGNMDMVDKDDRYDEGVRVDGRLAFYLKGKVLGKYLIKACVDTERLPGGRYRTKDLFTNLDPDKYYPVYGDASTVNYEGVDTQDVAFVLIEWDESFAKWGSFNTEMPFNIYERTLSGGIVNYVSVGKTKFGDPWTIVKGFGAVSRQQAAHDEFVGTGGSLYYLRHQDVIEGSEKLRIEVRDRLSKSTISSIPLADEKDYEIDYDSGRILLKKPLNSVQQGYNSSIISNDLLMGERIYLVVDYEFLTNGLSENAWGGRASQQIGHHVRVGGSYVQEQKDGPNYEVYSGDATLKLNKDTSVNVFYGHSKETQLGSSSSYDGGLTFSNQLGTFSNGKTGEGYSINGRTRLFKNTDIYLSHSKYDPYFSISDSISQQGTEKYIATVYSQLTQHLAVGLNHLTSKIKEETTPIAQLGARDVHTTTAIMDYRRGKWDLRGECQHQEVKNPQTKHSYFGMLPLEDNNFVAARAGYQLFKWLHAYVRGQGTVCGRTDNQGTVGADISIWGDTTLNIAETVGNMGDSTLLGVTSKVTEGTDVYANLEVGNHLRLGRYARTTYGQSSMLSETNRVYLEEDYSSWRENIVRGTVLGYEEKISETFALGLTYERSNVERRFDSNVINRDAGSVSLTYLNPDEFFFNTKGIKGFSKVELRNDRGTSEVRQWVTENDLLWRLTEGLSLTGRGNWSWTEDRDAERNEAEFYEVGSGFSLRPVNWDRLNILGKYSYLTNLPPDSQIDFIEKTESRRHVYAIEGLFDVLKWVQLVGKVAYRDMREKVGYRNWTDSDTYLYLGRANFHVTSAWDIAAEYRTLRNKQIEDNKSGWLLEVDREIGKYIRLGVGYNFTDYDDDLRNEDKWDAKGWFVRINGKY